MNPERLFTIIVSALDRLTGTSLPSITHAVMNGEPTDEQLAVFTECVHNGFDLSDGCMIHVVTELAELDVPHYVINHAIRTYVRLNDKREAEAREDNVERAARAAADKAHGASRR